VSRPDAIQPVSAGSKYVKLLVYGDPGVGKTRLAGSGGEKTLIIHPPVDHVDSILDSGASHWEVHNWNEMLEALEYARHEGDEWEWVWLDSISLWQDIGLDDVWAETIAQKPDRWRYGLDRGEYRVNMWRLEQWVRHMVGSENFNFGITAHPQWATFDIDGTTTTKLMPWIQGKAMPQKISGYMNIVAYMNIRPRPNGKEGRYLYTQSSANFYAKDQFTAFGEKGVLAAPTIPKMMEQINEARRAASPTRRRRQRRTLTNASDQVRRKRR
jgi:AAA domain